MTLFRLALRSHRTGTIATGAIGAISGILNGGAYIQIAGHDPAARQAFAQQMEILGRQLAYLLPRPVQLETLAGYLTWRSFGTVATIYAIWGLLAATGAGRGDEERGLTELWLASGVSRVRWVLVRSAGFVVMAALSVAVTMAVTAAAAAGVGEPLPLAGVLGESLPLIGLTLWGFGIGLIVAQLVATRRGAAVIAGIAVIALFTLNSVLRAGGDPGALKWLSPFYLFDRSAPLLAGGTLELASCIALLVEAAFLVAVAGWAFARRDLGGILLRARLRSPVPAYRPSRDPLLRLPVLALVGQQRGWIAGWAVAMAALAYFLASLARTMVDSLRSIPSLQVYLERLGLLHPADMVGVIWFSTALLILSIFVVAQVNGWAADDAEGRLETALAAGASRPRVVVERIAALLVASAVVIAVSTAAVWLASGVFDLGAPVDRLFLAGFLMLPVVFALGSIGHVVVGWRPRVAVVLLGAVAVISYFTQEFAPLFDLPEWVGRTSFFVLYGQPMTRVDVPGAATLMLIGVVGAFVAIAAMERRDVGR